MVLFFSRKKKDTDNEAENYVKAQNTEWFIA